MLFRRLNKKKDKIQKNFFPFRDFYATSSFGDSLDRIQKFELKSYDNRLHFHLDDLDNIIQGKMRATISDPVVRKCFRSESPKYCKLLKLLMCRFPKNTSMSIKEDMLLKKIKPLISISFWIPRKHREAIIGDIIEDCYELRMLGKSKLRICIHVIWQLIIAFRLLWHSVTMYTFKSKAN